MSNNLMKEERLAAFREQRWAEMVRIKEEERLEQQRAEEARQTEEERKAEEARWAEEARRCEEEEAAENEKAAASHKRTMSDNVEAGPSQKRPKAPVVCTNCMKREQECVWWDSEWIWSCQWCVKNKQGCIKVGEGPKKTAGKRKVEKGPVEPMIEPLGRHTVIVDNRVFGRLIRDVCNLGEEVELLRESNQVLGEGLDRLTVVMKQMVSVAEGKLEYSSEEDEPQGAKERKVVEAAESGVGDAVEDKGSEMVAEVKRGPNDPLLEEVEKLGLENTEQEEESKGSEDS
ncbi:hypothetical protein AX17_005360 [Amanita inopinata Kibby_2008]|nr:hypothetical protein AX17_005360 [Amanita inopinata Kibby_2008]